MVDPFVAVVVRWLVLPVARRAWTFGYGLRGRFGAGGSGAGRRVAAGFNFGSATVGSNVGITVDGATGHNHSGR